MITGKNYIGNNLSGTGNKIHKTFNSKSNNENPTNFIEATSKEVNQAVDLADEAFQVYKNVSGKEKSIFFKLYCRQNFSFRKRVDRSFYVGIWTT